jgi:hypothetical protein
LRQWRKAEEFLKIAGLTVSWLSPNQIPLAALEDLRSEREVWRFEDLELDLDAPQGPRRPPRTHTFPIAVTG